MKSGLSHHLVPPKRRQGSRLEECQYRNIRAPRTDELTVSWTRQLMDEQVHIILTVDVADFAVGMSWLLDLVTDHRLLSLEVPKAILIGTLDLHLDGAVECERWEVSSGRDQIVGSARTIRARSSSETKEKMGEKVRRESQERKPNIGEIEVKSWSLKVNSVNKQVEQNLKLKSRRHPAGAKSRLRHESL